MPFLLNTFDVTIQLETLTCVKEFDSSGHSEPYLWSAFLFADDMTLASANPLGVLVPLETQSGHGVFGPGGKSVRPGAVIPIPESIGLFKRRLFSHQSIGPFTSDEIMFAGFVGVLLEEDETSGSAIAAGHKELAPALQDEILQFFLANRRFPDTSEIAVMKEKIEKRVRDTIASKVGCWSGFWSDQDDMIGVAGDEDTLFTASEIRALSSKGRTPRQTSILGSELIFRSVPPFGFVPVTVDHEYILNWSIRVEPILDIGLPTGEIEQIGLRLEELDFAIGELVTKLDGEDGTSKGDLQAELEEKAKRIRPRLVRELQAAWVDLAQEMPEAETTRGTS
jgi:hypothetical protein